MPECTWAVLISLLPLSLEGKKRSQKRRKEGKEKRNQACAWSAFLHSRTLAGFQPFWVWHVCQGVAACNCSDHEAVIWFLCPSFLSPFLHILLFNSHKFQQSHSARSCAPSGSSQRVIFPMEIRCIQVALQDEASSRVVNPRLLVLPATSLSLPPILSCRPRAVPLAE